VSAFLLSATMQVFTKLHLLALYTAVQQQSLGEVVAFILETCADISDCNGEKVARISQQSPKTLQK